MYNITLALLFNTFTLLNEQFVFCKPEIFRLRFIISIIDWYKWRILIFLRHDSDSKASFSWYLTFRVKDEIYHRKKYVLVLVI